MTNKLPIYVGFSFGTSWVSKIITWITGNGPSHAFLLYPDPTFGWVQLGSESGGWMLLPAEQIKHETRGLYRIPYSDLWRGLRKNADRIGCGYDFGGLLGMAPVIVLWRLLKVKIRNPLQSAKRWFCSEAVNVVIRDGGGEVGIEPGATDPKRLELDLIARGAVKVEWLDVVVPR